MRTHVSTSAFITRPKLREAADLRSMLLLASLTAIYVVQFTAAQSSMWFLPTAVLAFVACIIKHNHLHCRTFTTPGWNSAMNFWLSIATAQPATGIITVHNDRHHRHAQSEDDFVRCSLVGSRSNVINFLLFAPRSVFAMLRDKPSDLRAWRERAPRLHRQAVAERVITYAVAGGLLWLDWHAALLFWALPCALAQWALLTINLLQHQGCDHDSRWNHSRNITGPVANWLFLNNGYHTAHHERPGLHWSRLPAFHAREVAPHMDPALEDRSLTGSLWRRMQTPHKVSCNLFSGYCTV